MDRDARPKCPECGGLLLYEPPDISGCDRVFCRICGWLTLRYNPTPAFDNNVDVPLLPGAQNTEQNTLKPVPLWAAQLTVRRKRLSSGGNIDMGKNTLADLNNHLFDQMKRLSEADGDKLKVEIERTKALSGLANSAIENAKVALEAHRCLGGKTGTPAMLQLEAE